MALEDEVGQYRESLLEKGLDPVSETHQGVSKERIKNVLQAIDRYNADQCDAVFALLDERDSFYHFQYKSFKSGLKFCDGATTAHVACHFGILQRGDRKSDREGRDAWLKPLWEVGAMEKVFYEKTSHEFIPGHPVAKSPYTCYRLSPEFIAILKAPESDWQGLLDDWVQDDKILKTWTPTL